MKFFVGFCQRLISVEILMDFVYVSIVDEFLVDCHGELTLDETLVDCSRRLITDVFYWYLPKVCST